MKRATLTALAVGLLWITPLFAIADPAPVAAHRGNATSVLRAAVRRDPAAKRAKPDAPGRPLLVGVLLIVLVGAAKILLRRHLSRRHAVSLDLVMVVIGFVLLLMMLLPISGTSGWLGIMLFVGLAAVYRLLGHFEEPSDKE